MKFFLETYGCSLNQSDSEFIEHTLKGRFSRAVNPESADVIIINTCGVKGPTENKIISRILELKNQGKRLVIAGCLPRINRKRLEKELQGSDYSLIDPNSSDRIMDAVEEKGGEYFSGEPVKERLDFETEGVIGTIPICAGCLGACTYCAVRLARGKLYSYPPGDIIRLAKRMVDSGVKEIRLTAQDTGCYGRDIGMKLTDLLKKLLTMEGDYFIRIGMMNPHYALEMLEDLKKIYMNEHVFKFAHIPVQSGSNKVLREMGRKYKVGDFVSVVEGLRGTGDISISTDIIAGYPTETEQDFRETLGLIRTIKPDVLNISKFCPRPGTPAAGLKQLPTQLIKERSRSATALFKGILNEKKEGLKGMERSVIVTERRGKRMLARDTAYRGILLEGVSIGERVKIYNPNA